MQFIAVEVFIYLFIYICSVEPRVYMGIPLTRVTVNLDKWPPPPMVGARGQKNLILTTLNCWKRPFWEQNYIENYFYLLKLLKLLLKNVEELLFGGIFLGTFTGQTVLKHVWVSQWFDYKALLVCVKDRAWLRIEILAYCFNTSGSICGVLFYLLVKQLILGSKTIWQSMRKF